MIVQKHGDVNAVSVEAQGTLFAIAKRSNASSPVGGGRRGNVTGFSYASRRRMLRKLARLNPRRITFITLTYADNMTDDTQAYAHLRALFERWRRRWPQMSALWRKEYQRRGAVHFHILAFNMPFYYWKSLRAEWAAVTGHHFPAPLFVRIEKVKSKRGAMHYVSKYMAKPSQPPEADLLDLHAYPHAPGPTDPYAAWRPPLDASENQSTGRFWGIFNKSMLPYAPLSELTIRIAAARSFHDVKKMLRREWDGFNRSRQNGGVIFSDRAYGLWADAVRLLVHDIHDEWYAPDLIRIGV